MSVFGRFPGVQEPRGSLEAPRDPRRLLEEPREGTGGSSRSPGRVQELLEEPRKDPNGPGGPIQPGGLDPGSIQSSGSGQSGDWPGGGLWTFLV